jgi:hypothetical protein
MLSRTIACISFSSASVPERFWRATCGEWSYRFNRRNLPDGLGRYLIRRAVECATITYNQLKAGAMSVGAARVRRLPAIVGQPEILGGNKNQLVGPLSSPDPWRGDG